ncbi:hypothetical protein [Pseudomonas sp. PSKL.D1]|uniref:hypothetical protein n=1 Tax=Pseudomonas sp. PSKL.D1 TaxID=3029060 RepID=UPI0023812CB8|nr:hypothetical protein [Pseudomonas sp. PSKL.D1]WDY58513.1 hypothetical protein PVV54_02410 [Pseudomonas sp. PSKL.D1]
MTANSLNKPKAENPHFEAAKRIRQLAQILAANPAEAKAFREMTGVYNSQGDLKEAYR